MKVFMFQVENINMEELISFLKENTTASEREIREGNKGYQIIISEHFFKEVLLNTNNFGLDMNRDTIIDFFVEEYEVIDSNNEHIFDYVIEKYGFSIFGYKLVHDTI